MPKALFAEFSTTPPRALPAGDVEVPPGLLDRHHDERRPGPPSLAFNPSHLEIVNRPLFEGSVKARLDRRGDQEGDSVLPIIVHGDAASPSSVVMETLALAQTRGYYTGALLHVVSTTRWLHHQRPGAIARFDAVLHRRGGHR